MRLFLIECHQKGNQDLNSVKYLNTRKVVPSWFISSGEKDKKNVKKLTTREAMLTTTDTIGSVDIIVLDIDSK